ncbi:MAG: nucleotide exchange factor GrpE [Acidimicrobiales bacterium]
MAPSPGHPGHFPRPPGWVERPGGPDAPAPKWSTQEATGGSAASEASAKVAEMLCIDADDDGAEIAAEVEEAAEAVAQDIDALAAVEAQRDEYLDSLRRLQADFENYKKRIQRQQAELSERAAEKLVESLLPALDAFDLAMAHADTDASLDPVYRTLLGVLAGAGLERLDPAGQPFDPTEHDAVLHEEGGDTPAPEVIEVLRAGYKWKGRVLRPAMVKVKG